MKATPKVAFVLLSAPKLPSAEDITRAAAGFPKSTDEQLGFKSSEARSGDQSEVLELEFPPGGTALVALLPVAVPGGEAEAAARHSVSSFGTGWKLPPHNAQLVVTLKETISRAAADQMRRFTLLLAAVTEASGAVGVYWGNAGATHDPKFLVETARERDVSLQLPLWTGVSLARQPGGRLSLLSLGMQQLALPDLLLTAPGSAGNAALGDFFDLLSYVVDRGTPLPEGDTVGRTAAEKVPVRYVPSPIDPSRKVWSVDLK